MRAGYALAATLLILVSGCGQQTGVRTTQPSTSATPTGSVTASPARSVVPRRTDSPAPQATTTDPPSPTPAGSSAPKIVVVTDTDSGRTVHLRPADRLEVRLSQDSYDPPTSSSAILVRRSSTGGYPSADPVKALFEARAPGSADVSASSDYACFHSSPRCLRPTRLWSVHVVVG